MISHQGHMIYILLNTTKILSNCLYVINRYIIKIIVNTHTHKFGKIQNKMMQSLCSRLNKYIKVSIEKLYPLHKLEKSECMSLNSKKVKNIPRELHFLQRLPDLCQPCKYFVMISEVIRYTISEYLRLTCITEICTISQSKDV